MSELRTGGMRLLSGLAVAMVLLLLAEGGARLLPLDRWEEGNRNTSYPVFVPGEGEDRECYITNPHFHGAMNPQKFLRKKPPGVKRIFVLGGSAALGWPGPAPTAFSGYMQRALDEVAPGEYEIVNAAAMSYGSHRVLDVLSDVVKLDPDLVVIWSGNNEYVERSTISPHARKESWRGVQRIVRHSGLYRSVRLLLHVIVPQFFVRPEGEDFTDLRASPLVRRKIQLRSPEVDRQVQENYRANLEAMGRTLRESRVDGILCTVPVNLSGWVPDRVIPVVADPEQAGPWEATRQEVIAAWEQGRYDQALPGSRRLLAVTPQYAFAHYLLGDSLRSLGHHGAARKAFEAARNLDTHPVRALSVFDEVVREVATHKGLYLVDLAQAFVDKSDDAGPGLDLFLDYVHPNEAGHKLAAVTVLRGIQQVLDPALPTDELVQWVERDDWSTHNTYNQADHYYALGLTYYDNGQVYRAEQAFLRALEEDPTFAEAAGNLGSLYARRGDLDAAKVYYRRAVAADPEGTYTAGLASILRIQGDFAGAREVLQPVLRCCGETDPALFTLLGDIAFDEGQFALAASNYQRAIEMGMNDPELFMQLGETFKRLGDAANSRAAFARAQSR